MRALVTLATGRHRELLAITGPLMQRYAARHGYAFLDATELVQPERPASWWKVQALGSLLVAGYREVLWMDADVAIVDGSVDLASEVPASAWQALVRHHTADGEVPNGGVWLVRPPMLEPLAAIWAMTQYVEHVWWEQAALLDLLGYRHEPRPCRLVAPTELCGQTVWLGLEWNSHEGSDRHPSPRFAHVTPNTVDWRLPILRDYAARAVA